MSSEVLQHVIAVQADPVARVQGGGRAADEDCAGNQVLQVALRGEQPFPVRELVDGHHDERIVPRGVVPDQLTRLPAAGRDRMAGYDDEAGWLCLALVEGREMLAGA
jgi:hypothetical protein